MRGLGQGGSLGLNDEISPAIAGKLSDWFGPSDPDGIPREYAAGSAYDDMRNTERRENQESADKYPVTYRAAQIAGGVPSSIAMSSLGAGAPSLAARIASGGLAAGARGGIEGAGLAEDGNRLEGAARAAGPSAVLGMAGAAAPAAANAIKNMFKGGPPSGPVPALATASAGGPSAREITRGAQAARSAGASAGSVLNRTGVPTEGPTPSAKTAPPPRRPRTSMVDQEAAGGRKLGPEEVETKHAAINPPKGYGGGFSVPKSQRLPKIERLDFDTTASELADDVTPQGVTNAPRALMGEPPTVFYPQERPTVPSAALGQGPRIPFVEPNAPPTVPPDAISPAAQDALKIERAPFMAADDVVAGHEMPTVPPDALHYEQAMGPVRERARNAMLPPSTEEALDRSLISGVPEQRIPTEMTGRLPPARTNFERLPNETDAQMEARLAVQDAEDRAALHQAQGKEAGAHLRPRPVRSGQSMFNADQLARKPHPKMPTEYKKPERPTGGYNSEFPEGHAQHGEGATAVKNEFGEYEFGSNSGAKKKTDVKSLMKKRPDDSGE